MKRTLALALALFLLGCLAGSCKAAQSAADSACEALIAYNDTPLEESICATMDDFIALGNLILGSRSAKAAAGFADGGQPPASTCQMVPHTDVCATQSELRVAIKARKSGAK